MTIICPQCSLENPDQSTFCRRCGTPLTQSNEPDNSNPGQFYVPPADTVIQQGFPMSAAPLPYQQMQPQNVSYAPLNAAPPAPSIPMPTQLGKRAFAGYGMPVSRASWLIADQQAQANTLLAATRDDLAQRNLPGLTINQSRLSERSFMVENRDYLTAHRGSASVFVYITPAGRDLYISRTTTAQTPLSLVRVAILTLFLILMIIGLAQSGSPPSTFGGFSLGAAISTILITFSYPLLLFFFVLIVASLLAWLIHNDPGMYLRPAIMNNFQMDDAALLEETVDNSLRNAAQTAGIDAGKIMAMGQGYRVRRRIRWI
ncbi:MAG TPA: zinc-ribbon domain-containing protein [Ktedonobacteraceae bacterium]|nr:zinc-ribbon domain-containing protein [Ktedonobacteraceae bacterium]